MGRNFLRQGVWALAILTCLAVAGAPTAAYADDHRAHVEAEGWFFIANPNPFDNSQEVKFGVTGKDDNRGHFDYYNTVTGLRVHGKLTSAVFHGNSCAGAPVSPTAPAVTVRGTCEDEASNCSFQMDLVDGGPQRGNDWVCNVSVQGFDKRHGAQTDNDPFPNVVNKGKIKIQGY